MKSLFILIALVIFGALLGVFSSIGVWEGVDLPWIPSEELGTAANTATENVNSLNLFNLVSIGGTVIETLVTTLTAVLFVSSILIAIGVPVSLAVAIQIIICVVYLWDLVPFIWGRVVR